MVKGLKVKKGFEHFLFCSSLELVRSNLVTLKISI